MIVILTPFYVVVVYIHDVNLTIKMYGTKIYANVFVVNPHCTLYISSHLFFLFFFTSTEEGTA